MGIEFTKLPWETREEFLPTGYCVHGIHYWPGKTIPYKHWPSAILDPKSGLTYDELTIFKGGAKSRRARIIARFQRLIESYSDEDLSNPNSTKSRIIQRFQSFIDSHSDGSDISLAEVAKPSKRRKRCRCKSSSSKENTPKRCSLERGCTLASTRRNSNNGLMSISSDDVRRSSEELPIQHDRKSSENLPLSPDGIRISSEHLPIQHDRQSSEKLTISPDHVRLSTDNSSMHHCDMEKSDDNLLNSLKNLPKISGDFEDIWKHSKYPFENLVFSGGGIKGYSYIGAVKALEDAGVMPQVKRFAGSSAGAMCIAALSVGYSSQDVARFFYVDLKATFQDQTCACICCVPRLYTRYGIHPAMRYYTGLGDILAAKCGNPDLTFKQYNETFDKELCIVVCNITKMCAEYCHHTTTPDLPIRQAVRMSMAVPCIFEPPVRKIDGQRNYYVDGSAGDHFPLHCFDGPDIGANCGSAPNEKTIGFYALQERDVEHVLWKNAFGSAIPPNYKPLFLPDSKLARSQLREEIKRRRRTEKDFDEKVFMKQLETFSRVSLEPLGLKMKHYEAGNKTHIATNNIIDYLVANLESLLTSQVISNLKPEDENRTIPINCGYIESHDYDIEPADREFMIMQGYASTRCFLQQYTLKRKKAAAGTRQESAV